MSETNDRSSQENMYESRQGDRAPISVQADGAPVGENNDVADPDSDKQLEKDEDAAIDKSNIIGERTRGAKPEGQYTEPSDKELGLEE